MSAQCDGIHFNAIKNLKGLHLKWVQQEIARCKVLIKMCDVSMATIWGSIKNF